MNCDGTHPPQLVPLEDRIVPMVAQLPKASITIAVHVMHLVDLFHWFACACFPVAFPIWQSKTLRGAQLHQHKCRQTRRKQETVQLDPRWFRPAVVNPYLKLLLCCFQDGDAFPHIISHSLKLCKCKSNLTLDIPNSSINNICMWHTPVLRTS